VRITIDSATGNVGLGDSSPEAILEVTTTSGNAGTDYFYISTDSASDGDVMKVDSSGNVGIGTTTPDHKLQVNGNIVPEAAGQDLGATGLEWDLITADITFANSFVITEKGDEAIMWLNPDGEEIMSLDADGNLIYKGVVGVKDKRVDELEDKFEMLEAEIGLLKEANKDLKNRIEELEITWWQRIIRIFKKE